MAEPELALGTVQWGLDYGIANQSGKPNTQTVRRMLDRAIAAGIDTLDTARAYGNSEEVIGALLTASERENLRIVTKLSPNVWSPGSSASAALQNTRESLEASRRALNVQKLDALLLHRAAHLTAAGGVIWDELKRERNAGRIGVLGVSAATPELGFQALEDPDVALIQVASSLLDQRLWRAGFFAKARQQQVEVHVRSVFLQGVAFLDPEALPAHLLSARNVLMALSEIAHLKGMEVGELWLRYAKGLPASRLVLGFESLKQLDSSLNWFSSARFRVPDNLRAQIESLSDGVLNPARW